MNPNQCHTHTHTRACSSGRSIRCSLLLYSIETSVESFVYRNRFSFNESFVLSVRDKYIHTTQARARPSHTNSFSHQPHTLASGKHFYSSDTSCRLSRLGVFFFSHLASLRTLSFVAVANADSCCCCAFDMRRETHISIRRIGHHNNFIVD